MRWLLSLWAGALALALMAPCSAQANEASCLPEADRMDELSYLRSLSLDLRGYAPSAEEYLQVKAEGSVSEALIHQ